MGINAEYMGNVTHTRSYSSSLFSTSRKTPNHNQLSIALAKQITPNRHHGFHRVRHLQDHLRHHPAPSGSLPRARLRRRPAHQHCPDHPGFHPRPVHHPQVLSVAGRPPLLPPSSTSDVLPHDGMSSRGSFDATKAAIIPHCLIPSACPRGCVLSRPAFPNYTKLDTAFSIGFPLCAGGTG